MSREEKLELIGEMGLDISALDILSDEDFSILYAGYQRKVMYLGNLIILAIRKAFTENCEPFDIPHPVLSREETFENLGIKEEEVWME